MRIKNIKTNFDLCGELIDSESLTYLLIIFDNGIKKYEVIDNYREINHLHETLEEFRYRVLIHYEVSNALYDVKDKKIWERDEDWWKK
jgi:hypothetical protein